MLPGSMQEAIKAKAARQKQSGGFKDPYVKRQMTKEEFLIEKQQKAARGNKGGEVGDGAAATGDGATVDISALLQGQQRMQQEIRQLTEQIRNLAGNGVGSSNSTTTTVSSSSNETKHLLESFQREMRQSQKQATNDLLAQMEDILLRQQQQQQSSSKASGDSPSSSPEIAAAAAKVPRLEREIKLLKDELAELKRENQELRNENERQQKASDAATKPAATPSSSSPSPPKMTTSSTGSSSSSLSSGGMQVEETAQAYQLKVANLPSGTQTSDLKISYGDGALELTCKGKTYSFQVNAADINAGGISATLLPNNGGLQITVPKK